MNLKIRQLEDDIIALLNDSDVPAEAKRLILGEVLHLVEKEADKAVAIDLMNAEPIEVKGDMKYV